MPTDAQKRAAAKYDAAHTIQVHLKLNVNTDSDILDRIRSQPSVQGYIKSLIRQDIAKGRH